MTTTIIYAHPYEKSLNHSIFFKVRDRLIKSDERINVIDLYKDKFEPEYSSEELKLFNVGKTTDPLVRKYQNYLMDSDKIIFIFPIWWNDMPAIVKGFIDKVFKMSFAYVDTKRGVKGLLTNIKKATILTTSKSPTWYLRFFAGNAIKTVFIKGTLKQIGITNVTWTNFDNVKQRNESECNKYINNITF